MKDVHVQCSIEYVHQHLAQIQVVIQVVIYTPLYPSSGTPCDAFAALVKSETVHTNMLPTIVGCCCLNGSHVMNKGQYFLYVGWVLWLCGWREFT